MSLFSILVMLLLVNFIAFSNDGDRQSLLIKATMVAMIFVVTVVSATFPKGRWALFRRDAEGTRPMAGYLLSGLVAVTLAIPISVGFNSLIFLGKDKAASQHSQTTEDPTAVVAGEIIKDTLQINHNMTKEAQVSAITRAWKKFISYSYPWLLMTFVSTVLTAFMVQQTVSAF